VLLPVPDPVHVRPGQKPRRPAPRRQKSRIARSYFSPSRGSGELVRTFPVGPASTRVADEIALKFLVATYPCVLARSTQETLGSRTRWHHTRAFPFDENLVPIRVRDQAGPVRVGASLVDVVEDGAVDSGLVHEDFARPCQLPQPRERQKALRSTRSLLLVGHPNARYKVKRGMMSKTRG